MPTSHSPERTQGARPMIDTARGWHQVSEIRDNYGPVRIEYGPGDPSVRLVAVVPRRLSASESLDVLVHLDRVYNRLKKVVAGHKETDSGLAAEVRPVNQLTTNAQEV